MAPGVGLRPFRFERTFDKEASQQAVYEQAARGAVVDLINGVNGCVLVYGQTGAGKTHTMIGGKGKDGKDGKGGSRGGGKRRRLVVTRRQGRDGVVGARRRRGQRGRAEHHEDECGADGKGERSDHQHVLALVEANHGADLDTVGEFAGDAGIVDDIGQGTRLSC